MLRGRLIVVLIMRSIQDDESVSSACARTTHQRMNSSITLFANDPPQRLALFDSQMLLKFPFDRHQTGANSQAA